MINNIYEYKTNPDYKLIKQRIIDCGTTDVNFFFGHTHRGGHMVQQLPDEFAAYLCWLRQEFKGNLIKYLEIGSCAGGSLRHVFEMYGNMEIYTCDNLSYFETSEQEKNFIGLKPYLKQFIGDSKSKEFKSWLEEQFIMFDICFIDAGHMKTDVFNDFEMVKKYMTNGYIVFHDTRITTDVCEVPDAIKQLINDKKVKVIKHFESDTVRPLGITVCEVI